MDRRHNGPEWVVANFRPRVRAELGQRLCVAFLVLPNHLRELEAENSISLRSANPNSSFQYVRFIDEGAANTWLKEQRCLVAGLVAP